MIILSRTGLLQTEARRKRLMTIAAYTFKTSGFEYLETTVMRVCKKLQNS